LTFFFRLTHKVLKLRPEGFHRAKLVTHLFVTLVKTIFSPSAYTYRNNTFQIPIQAVDVLEHLFHTLLKQISIFSVDLPPRIIIH
jgi:hypothetical protein